MDSFIKVSDDKLYLDANKKEFKNEPVDIAEFKRNIEARTLSIGVVGLGYSGLQMALSLAATGFSVTGIEFDPIRVRLLNKGKSYIENVSSDDLKKYLKTDRFFAVSDLKILSELDVVIVCDQVPTSTPKNKDVSFIMALMENIISAMNKTQLIIVEPISTPGTFDDIIFPLFEEQKLIVNRNFFLALSPERIEPGNRAVKFALVPRIVAGITGESKELASELLKTIFKQVVEVSSVRTAEMVKLFEQSYRWVNQALANQMMMMSHKLDVNIWEVIKAARSNPFEYIRYLPCPGYGAVSRYDDEQFALSRKKELSEYEFDIIDKAISINTCGMQRFIIDRITELLNEQKKSVHGSNILIVGIANKRNVADWHESTAVEIIKILLDKKANIYYHDPLVPKLPLNKLGFSLSSVNLEKDMMEWVDLVVILRDHKIIDFETIVKNSSLILDTQNATDKFKLDKLNVCVL